MLCLACLSPGCQRPASTPSFLWGIVFAPEANGRNVDAQVRDMREAGANAAKFWFEWSRVEPIAVTYGDGFVPASPGKYLTREEVRASPALIREYAEPSHGRFHGLIDWTYYDSLIGQLNRAGLTPVPLIADATTAPFMQGNTLRIAPEPAGWTNTEPTPQSPGYIGIGREEYLGHLLLFVAAAARRYSRGDLNVSLWNTENELNWTYVHVLVAKWRKGDAWLDDSFLLDLLATLYEGVHLGNPDARATMNLNISDPDWMADARRYAPFMDVIGLGAYPNYLFGMPILDQQVTDAVDAATRLGKPVMVLETGYPSGPVGLDWSAENQANYLQAAIRGAYDRGAAGYFHFKLDDEAAPRDAIQQVENHWGLVDVRGDRKPSFFAFLEAAARGY